MDITSHNNCILCRENHRDKKESLHVKEKEGMVMVNNKTFDTIQATKEGFEKSFKEKSLYNRQTQDNSHLEKIIKTINIKHRNDVLDLGTGSGYLAFKMARENRTCRVIGLDIVEEALKDGGVFFISDPTPNENDKERFVDDYMRMKKDGHIKYYTKNEFEGIIERHNNSIIKGYNVEVTEDNKYIYITQRVLNLLFKKEKSNTKY